MPVGNVIEDNTYCHERSMVGPDAARFLDRDDATIRSWMSAASNNREACP